MNWKVNSCVLIALVLLLLFCNLAWADESQLVWSRFLGGNNIDSGYDIIIGDSGFVHVGERSRSNDFPITFGACGQANDGSYSTSHPDGAQFTGTFSDTAVDYNGNGLYDFLSAQAEVEVTVVGEYGIHALLKSNDTLISTGPFYNAPIFSSRHLSLDAGLHNVTLNFSGEDIYESGLDGNYTVFLRLLDESGARIDTASFSTSLYSHTEFGEIPAKVGNSSDYGLDTDSDGFYNYLVAEVSIEATKSMHANIEGMLNSDTVFITTAYDTAYLNSGTNIKNLYFEGTEIRETELDGSYSLIVMLSDKAHTQIHRKEFSTDSYNHTSFQRKIIQFSDQYNDYGTDSDANGLFDFLTLEVGLDVEVGGNYEITGWLRDGDRVDICYTDTLTYLDIGSQTAYLNFDGTRIRKHGVDGPYQLSYLIIRDENDSLINNKSQVYTTSIYSYSQFEKLPSD